MFSLIFCIKGKCGTHQESEADQEGKDNKSSQNLAQQSPTTLNTADAELKMKIEMNELRQNPNCRCRRGKPSHNSSIVGCQCVLLNNSFGK